MSVPKPSVFDTMDPKVRAWLEETLVERGFGGLTEIAEELAREHKIEVARSTLGAFSKDLKDRIARMRERAMEKRQVYEAVKGDVYAYTTSAVLSLIDHVEDLISDLRADAEGDPAKSANLLAQALKNLQSTLSTQDTLRKSLQAEQQRRLDDLERQGKAGKRAVDLDTLNMVREALAMGYQG